MKLIFYKPTDNTLKKYIQGYYFISEDKNADSFRYFTFPNNYIILSATQNVKIELKDKKFVISSTLQKNIRADLVCSYSEPLEVIFKHPINEITIYFKPLGINYFLNNPEIFKQKIIENFNPFSDFKNAMENIFNQSNRNNQIEQLENYWLSKFEKVNLSLMEKIISDIEANLKILEIAEKYNFTRQYINKLFLKYIGKTPSEYRKIHRFRNSISRHKIKKNLTELSYDSLFFDQSHFIKDFKIFTSNSPSSFFKAVDTEKENIWLFI